LNIFNILHQNCDVFGKKILEASAGTGKTFAIEHIVVRLLIEKNSLLSIDQILIVTFTKKATKELKFRIRNNLEKALLFLNQNKKDKNFDYLIPFFNDKEAILKLQNAIDLFETAQIFTIHSFCFKNLKEFSLEADVLIEKDEESQNLYLIKKLVYDYLKFNIDSKEYSNEQIEILINFHKNIDNLCQKFINEIDTNLQKYNFKNFSNLYEEFLQTIKNFQKIDFNIVSNSFLDIEKNYKKNQKFKNENFIKQLELLVFFINKKFCSKEEFGKLLKTKCSIFEFLSDKNQKKSKKNEVLPDFFYQMKKNLYPLIQELIDPKILFFRLLKDISLWINQYFEDQEILTFNEILFKMKNAIKTDAFKKRIQKKYKAVIIDEFQDTDTIQFEIFDKLFFSNKNILAVYLIGDPKQSIYSFRNADLYTYLNATNKIKTIRYLDTNYRSSKSLINSLNALFNENFAKKWLKLPRMNESLKYLPVKSGLNTSFYFKDNLAPLHFFIAEDCFKNKKWPTEEIEQKYFSYILNEIIKLKNEHNFLNSNFAVLVNDRYQAERLKNYFYKNAIESNTTRNATLKNSIVIDAFKEFFEAVFAPHDLNKIKKALKGPFIQISDDLLKNLKLDQDVFYIQQFYFLKAILLKGINFFFNSFFYSSWPDKTVLENITSLHDINFYHETISLIELLITQKKLTSHQLLNFLKNLKDLDENDESLKVKQKTDSGVQILTTFMSKGLEYEIVFALSLANRNNDEFNNNLAEIDAEKMRQFYVALTRAKYRVYLPIAIDINEKQIKEGSFSCMEYFFTHVLQTNNFINKEKLLNKLEELKSKNHISYNFIDSLNVQANFEEKQKVVLNSYKKLNNKFSSSYIYSFSSLHKEENFYLNEKKENIDLPIGPQIGIFFHSIFEKIINKKSFEEKVIRKIIKDKIDDEFEEFEDKIYDIIKKTIEAPLLNENSFCLKDITFDNLKTEIEFLFSTKNNYIKGFIDLVFLYEDKYYIIDWKTNFLGFSSNDYNIENIEKQMIQHNYYLQAAIYSESLKRYLNLFKKGFTNLFGGVFYIFLRGLLYGKRKGIYHFFPNFNLLNEIDKKQLKDINWKI